MSTNQFAQLQVDEGIYYPLAMIVRVEFTIDSKSEAKSVVVNMSNGTDVYVRNPKWVTSIRKVIDTLAINK